MTAQPAVRTEPGERVTVVRLDHGANALDPVLLGALDQELAALTTAGAPALVLASARPGLFCPGLDLKAVDGWPRTQLRDLMVRFSAVLCRLAAYPGAVVAAVAGHAIAGGCLLALACDRRVMARAGARLGLSEINLGVPVPAGAVAMLLALYPTRTVEQLVLEGDGLGGERAFELGLVERLADPGEVENEAMLLAAHMGSRPAGAMATAKRYLRHGLAEEMARRDQAEMEHFLDHWYHPETQDRIGAVIAAMGRRQI